MKQYETNEKWKNHEHVEKISNMFDLLFQVVRRCVAGERFWDLSVLFVIVGPGSMRSNKRIKSQKDAR